MGEEEYIGFVEKAVNNPGSYEHASFYNFILNCFVEADEQCQGRITYDQFDKLLSRAATVPPSTEARKKMSDELELKCGGKGTGYVTTRTFWEWTVVHFKGANKRRPKVGVKTTEPFCNVSLCLTGFV